MKKILTKFLAIILISYSVNVLAQVPSQWSTAKPQLTAKLNTLIADAASKWDNQAYCTDFSGNLLIANSNRGYSLFSPVPPNAPNATYQTKLLAAIDTMLMAFDTLGYKTVDIAIQYPLLVNTFPNNKNYLSFYKRVYALAHSHGFKIIEGCQAAFVDTTFGEPYMSTDVKNYYFNPDGNSSTNDALTVTRYEQEKLQMMQTIIDSLKPDYLTLEMEPSTQQTNMFNLISFSPANFLSYINYFTANLNKGTVKLGAGAGSWDGLTFFSNVATTNIDYIDYHIYPVNLNTADNIVFKIDSIADANNKKLLIGEAWCYKSNDTEIATNPYGATAPQIYYSRDPFDYWQNVDTLFIRSMIQLSQQSKVEVVSFFWSIYMFGQLTYNPSYAAMTPSQIINAGQQYAYTKMNKFILDPVGVYTKKEIAKVCASTTGIKNNTFDQGSTLLYPNPATDNFIIDLQSDEKFSIIIYDHTGRKIHEVLDIFGKYKIDCKQLAGGFYNVQIKSKTTLVTKKLIKE